MLTNNHRMLEDLLPPSPQPRVFRLSQGAGPQAQRTVWGSEYEAPSTLGNCHAAIARALAGDQAMELTWWSAMLERHLGQLVGGYMEGCRTAHHWNLPELAQVHWYAFAVKTRLRGARYFPSLWAGAGRTLAALQVIQS